MDPAAMIAETVEPDAPRSMKPDTLKEEKYVEFAVPEGFVPPEKAKPDQDFQALGTFRIKKDGAMCLIAVDGSAVSPGAKEPLPPAPPVA